MDKVLLVGMGGFLGSILRYLTYQVFDKPMMAFFPWATFTVNVTGSLLLGVFYALAVKHSWFTDQWRLFFMIGFCGSFTTFSTFAWESVDLLKTGEGLAVILYISASVILSFAAVFAGYYMVK